MRTRAIVVTLLILLLAGLILGVFSALFGVGGGVIIIPTLQFLYPGMVPQEWVGTSFAIILMTTSLNTYLFIRGGFVIYKKIIAALAFGLTVGIISGQYISFLLPIELFYIVFGLTLFFIGSKRLFLRKTKPTQLMHGHSLFATAIAGYFIGVLSGLVGIGGGTLIIPYLMLGTKIPVKSLSFHSNMVMIIGSLFAVTNMMLQPPPITEVMLSIPFQSLSVGYIHWGIALCFFAGIVTTARIGIKMGKELSEELTDKVFAFILFSFGLYFLYQAAFYAD